jgi:predicted nuclease with TOPRIM domain
LKTKYECVIEELKQVKDQHEKKRVRIESFDRITDMFKKDKAKFEEEIQHLRIENELLKEKTRELQPPVAAATTTAAARNYPRENSSVCISFAFQKGYQRSSFLSFSRQLPKILN